MKQRGRRVLSWFGRFRLVQFLHRHWPLELAAIGLVILIAPTTIFAAPPPSDIRDATANEIAAVTYGQTWSLVELMRHIELGDVVAITAVPQVQLTAPSTTNYRGGTAIIPGPLPMALLRDGQKIPVVLGITYPAAMNALRSSGYERLMSNEALSAASNPTGFVQTAGGTVPPPPFDWRPLVGLIGLALLIGGVIIFARRHWFSSPAEAKNLPAFVPRRKSLATGAAGAHGAAPSLSVTDSAIDNDEVTFDQVAGLDEAKLEVMEVVEFLREPERFTKLGAKIPRGLLFYGSPGNGKTLLARAIANASGVDFYHASGSEFVNTYVGVGASAIRKLVAAAEASVKAGQGAIIFIDELDAVARRRGGPNGNDEREATLNQLLVAMDGFASNQRIIWIGASNRVDVLDPAVLRPGRFSRKIPIPQPDRIGREAILRVHALGKPLAPEVDLGQLARKTAGYSAATLADLLNEAAILTVRRHGEQVGLNDLRMAALKIALGTGRQRSMPVRERSITAAHEAGHAVVGYRLSSTLRVDHISLYQHGEALGVTVSEPLDDNLMPSESHLRVSLAQLMGGRAAEEICFAEPTGGAANDFAQATDLARHMVVDWGLHGDPKSLSYIVGEENSPALVQARETAIRRLLDDAYAQARSVLLTDRDLLDRLGAYLFEHERIDGEEFAELMTGQLAPSETERWAWRDAASQPRSVEEIADMIVDGDLVPLPPAIPLVEPPAAVPVITPRASAPTAPASRRRSRESVTLRWWRRVMAPHTTRSSDTLSLRPAEALVPAVRAALVRLISPKRAAPQLAEPRSTTGEREP
jgi:cell division protease FtsH